MLQLHFQQASKEPHTHTVARTSPWVSCFMVMGVKQAQPGVEMQSELLFVLL